MGADAAFTRRGHKGLLQQAPVMGARAVALPPQVAERAAAPAPGAISERELILRERFMFENYIGGGWCRPAAGRYLTQACAAGGNYGGSVARSDACDISRACAAARRASGDWVRRGRAVRRAELGNLPGHITAQALDLAMAERWDHGLPSPELDLRSAERQAGVLRDIIRALQSPPAGPQRSEPLPDAPRVATLIRAADVARTKLCRTLLPLLYDGHAVVVLLIYRDVRRLPVGLLQLLGTVAAAVPPGVLNVLTGLGVEAGVALLREDCAGFAPARGR